MSNLVNIARNRLDRKRKEEVIAWAEDTLQSIKEKEDSIKADKASIKKAKKKIKKFNKALKKVEQGDFSGVPESTYIVKTWGDTCTKSIKWNGDYYNPIITTTTSTALPTGILDYNEA